MKVLSVVQARYGSTRLPGKAAKPLCGTTMLGFLLQRIKGMGSDVFPVFATTRKPEDDILVAIAQSLDVPVLRGDENDLVSRFVACLDEFGGDACIRITGDNPLTSRTMIRNVQEGLLAGHDYVDGYSSCIHGIGVDGLSGSLLRSLHSMDLTPEEREHINLRLLNDPELYPVHKVPTPSRLQCTDISLTVDTLEEYEAMVRLLVQLNDSIENIGVAHVLG